MLVCIWIFLVVRAWIRACEYAGFHACKLNGECDTSHGQDSCKCDCTCTFLLRNLRGYVYAHRCFIDFQVIQLCSLFQVLELAASLFVPNFVFFMPMWWVRKCSGCDGWAQGYGDLPTLENVYCYRCLKWWYDMHAEIWWPATRAYIVMLARCSVQDNPDAVP